MNDFTKEELEETLYALEQWCHPECDYPRYIALRNKIQSMIDTHCPHQNITTENAIIDKCKDCNWSGFKT